MQRSTLMMCSMCTKDRVRINEVRERTVNKHTSKRLREHAERLEGFAMIIVMLVGCALSVMDTMVWNVRSVGGAATGWEPWEVLVMVVEARWSCDDDAGE